LTLMVLRLKLHHLKGSYVAARHN